MALCEEKIPEDKKRLYAGYIKKIIVNSFDEPQDYQDIEYNSITASPRQRAKALYKTME
jgi:hypothetical protein